MPHQCPTNDEGEDTAEITPSCFPLRHWWGIGGAFVIHPCPGNLYGSRYSYLRNLFAAVLFVNFSAFASQSSTDRVRWAMFPISAAVVQRCPYSTSQLGALRFFTQSRKLRAWSASLIWPSSFFASIIGFAPVRQPFSSSRFVG